jgi:RNA-binding protein
MPALSPALPPALASTLPTALSQTARKALKARAHHLDPVVLIGDAGLTPAVLREIDSALKSHELIKVRMSGDDRDVRSAAYESICTELFCAPVQQIGKLLVLYRASPDKDKPKAAKRPAPPRRTKKQLAVIAERKKRPQSIPRSPAEHKIKPKPASKKARRAAY